MSKKAYDFKTSKEKSNSIGIQHSPQLLIFFHEICTFIFLTKNLDLGQYPTKMLGNFGTFFTRK